MDYNIQSGSFSKLGVILDETHAGECGVADDLMKLVSSQVSDMLESVKPSLELPFVVFERSTLLKAKDDMDRYFEQIQKPSDLPGVVLTSESKHEPITTPLDDDEREAYWSMLSKFVNQSLIRNVFPLSSEASKGARLGGLQSEFRRVSIVFVSIPKNLDEKGVQRVSSIFIKEIETWKGVFQQFSADDKGRTLLACFGLPPWTFDKDAVHALKASMSFLRNTQPLGIEKLPVSVTTGDLLVSQLGNSKRRDASLLGDAVNLAARLLSISKKEDRLVCDEATFEATKQDVKLVSLGRHLVKGKMDT
ncbi:hypothetical protein HDV05_000262, partial [Chytridiales sp. JEL 0842]